MYILILFKASSAMNYSKHISWITKFINDQKKSINKCKVQLLLLSFNTPVCVAFFCVPLWIWQYTFSFQKISIEDFPILRSIISCDIFYACLGYKVNENKYFDESWDLGITLLPYANTNTLYYVEAFVLLLILSEKALEFVDL